MGKIRIYDPVKRREYYLRTRELKGRNYKARPKVLSNKELEEKAKANTAIMKMASKLMKDRTAGKQDTPGYKALYAKYVKAAEAYQQKYSQGTESLPPKKSDKKTEKNSFDKPLDRLIIKGGKAIIKEQLKPVKVASDLTKASKDAVMDKTAARRKKTKKSVKDFNDWFMSL